MLKSIFFSLLTVFLELSTLMSQDTRLEKPLSKNQVVKDAYSPKDNQPRKSVDQIELKSENTKKNKNDKFDWTRAVPWAISLMFFIFAIYQYVRLKKITKANTTAELEAEDEHRERKEHQSLHKSEELYRHTLKEELGTIRMLGSPEIQNLPVSLLDAFVSLDISETWRSESQYKPGKKFGMQRADRSFSPEAAIERAFKQYRMLLIIGEPGSGKTTLLKYYAMCCLSEHRYQKLGFKKPVFPIYFPLRELEPNDAYPSSLPENLVRWATRHGHDIAAETFYDWLHNRDTLVLLDGLDEISDLDQRKMVCEWIDNI